MIAVDKKKIIDSLSELPEKISIEQAMERLYFLEKVEKGIYQAESGQCVSHLEAREKLKKWFD